MEEYRELSDLMRNSSTDVVLEYIRRKNINPETFAYHERQERGREFDRCASPLGLAIKHGHLRVMNELISLGFDPTIPCSTDYEPMHPLDIACEYNRLDIIHALRQDHGLDMDCVLNNDGETALVEAVYDSTSEKTLDVVKTLVEAGASVNTTCRSGSTPLSVAIERQNIDACRYLILKGVDINSRKDVTCLAHALDCVDIDTVQSGADVNAVDDSNVGMDIFRLLFDYGADVNALDEKNKSPLCYALDEKCLYSRSDRTIEETVDVLVTSGADVNKLDINQRSSLMHAVTKGASIEVFRLLINAGANVNALDKENKSALCHVVISYSLVYSQEAIVNLLLESGADVNVLDINQMSPLLHALVEGANIDAIRVVVEYGANVNSRDKENKSALWYAMEWYISDGQQEAIVNLLIQYRADVNVLDNNQVSPLLRALVKTASIGVIRMLVESGADVNALDKEKKSALCYAIEKYSSDGQQEDIVNLLIESGADVNVLDNKMRSYLMLAVMDGASIGVIRLLVESVANVNSLDIHKKSTLVHAMKMYISGRMQEDIVTLLIQSGADVTVFDNTMPAPLILTETEKQSSLIQAIDRNAGIEVFRILLDCGADVNALNKSPLCYAIAKYSSEDIVKVLIQSGADLIGLDTNQMSPLLHALRKGENIDVIIFLIKSGANVKILDKNKKSALCYAMEIYSFVGDQLQAIVKVLIEAGADVNTLDKNMKSPLHYAVDNSGRDNLRTDIIHVLVDSRADVNIQDENGDSPLMYALKNKARVEVLSLFLKPGVNVCARNQENISPLSFIFERFDDFNHLEKYDGEVINLVQIFVKHAGDVKGHLVTLPYTRRIHDAFDVIRTLCTKGADIEAKDGTGNTILHQVITKISECSCAKCFNLVHFLIVELNMSLWSLNSANQTPFRCALKKTANRQEEVGKILKLCVQAGYNPDSEEMVVVRQIEEELSVDTKGIKESKEIKGSDVTSLKVICCFAVRRALGRRLPTEVNSLHIPETLKQLVKLTHVETTVETEQNTVEYPGYDDSFNDDDDDPFEDDWFED